ncbi:MAG: right-handed parallel beta-helix repeat-containing protein [Rhodospirillaceae bacterium]|nr:right-handed parallel beta-helix repeat-containing protein [Rhodospirillaceae bacterium]
MNLTTVSFHNTCGIAGSFNNSRNISLDNVNSYSINFRGFKFVQSQGINLSQVVVFTNYDYDNRSIGIWFTESQDVNLTNIGVGNFQATGISLSDTKNVIGSNISVIGKGEGIAIARNTDIDVNTVLSNIFLKIAATGLSSRQNSALRISAHGVRVSNVRIVDPDVEYAVDINNSRNVTISGVTITNSDDSDGAISIDSSTNVQVENVNVRGGNHSSIVSIEDSGSVHVKNVVLDKPSFAQIGIYAGTFTNLTPGSHKDITFENISIDGARTGVMVANGTFNELEISLKDVVIKNAKIVAFELFDRIYFKNLGGNKSISSASVCDGMINKNNGVVVDVGGASVICQ